jgi:glycerol-3-phosphate O-acyltransferase
MAADPAHLPPITQVGFEYPDIAQRRQEFADEIAMAIRRVNAIAEFARTR